MSLLNHVAHENGWFEEQDNKPKVTITVTGEIVGETTFTSEGKEYTTPLYKATVTGEDINGNPINETFEVSRFGVKNGKINPAMKPGDHTITVYKIMSTGIPGFQINNSKYFFHQQYGSGDSNFGCLTIKGKTAWTSFTSALSNAGWNSDLYTLPNTSILNVKILPTSIPPIKFK